MQIILLEKVKNLGAIGDVVNVRDGYARNFLLPRKKALSANASNIEHFEKRRQEIEAENAVKQAGAQSVSEKISGSFFTIFRQAADDGRLFGSVTARDIAAAVSSLAEGVDKSHIAVERPIKNLGVHAVVVSLHTETAASVYVVVARSEDEASVIRKKFEAEQSGEAPAAAQGETEAQPAAADADADADTQE
jgi:large subunit ribosomal protein L9